MASEFMSNVVRSKIRTGQTSEFLSSFEWDFKFVSVPRVIRNTGSSDEIEQLIRTRAISVQVPEDPVPQNMTVNIRSHRFQQIGDVPAYGQAAIQVQDFADQKCTQAIQKLIYHQSDPETKETYGAPNEYLFDMEFWRLDPQRQAIKVWRCHDCLFQAADSDEAMTSDKRIVGVTNIIISIDQYTIEYVTNRTALTSSYNFNNDSLNQA